MLAGARIVAAAPRPGRFGADPQRVPQRSVIPRTARARMIAHPPGTMFHGSATARQSGKGVRNMLLKGFSYAMIGAFAVGLAVTALGSAGILIGL
jgi:hypothetical protein